MSGLPRLYGRDEERERLATAVSAVQRGHGQVVLIEGEAGIGKTRLLDEVTRLAADHGMATRRGAAEELEQGRPFGALEDALGRATRGARADGAHPSAEETRYLAQDAIVEQVEALTSDGPLLLALDDLHWADRATLATAWALARSSAQAPLLFVLAFRPAPHPPDLERVVHRCTAAGAIRLVLAPLGEEVLADVGRDLLGHQLGPHLVDQLRGARGNPFVGIELLRALDAEHALERVDDAVELRVTGMSLALRTALLGRLTALPDAVREVLRVAAVLGGAGRMQDLAALSGRPLAELSSLVSEATRAGLLEEGGDYLAFRHDLIREALYADLPEAARLGLHAAAARILEGSADPGIVARHLVLGSVAGDPTTVDALRRVGASLAPTHPDAAVDVLTRARELERDLAKRAEIEADLAGALLDAGRAADSAEVARGAVDHADSRPTLARLHVARAEACSHLTQAHEAIAALSAALDLGVLSSTEAAAARARQAENRLWTFALDRAGAEAERALDDGRRLGLGAVVASALSVRCAIRAFRAEFDAATADGREAAAIAEADAAALRKTPHAYLALALLGGDHPDEARTVAEDGRRRSTELGQVVTLPNYQGILARIAWFGGRWDDALTETDAAAALDEDFGLQFGRSANDGVRGLIAFHRGDRETARAVLRRHGYPGNGQVEEAAGYELLVLLWARVLEADGDVAGAAKALLGLFDTERALGIDAARLWPGPECVRLALAAGAVDAAREVADDVATIAARAGTHSARGAAAHARGLVEDDPEALVDAADEFHAAGRPLDELLACEAAGAAFATQGQRDDAVRVLDRGLALADEIGAVEPARRATAGLRELGVRRGARGSRTRPRSGWESLTDAERTIAELVAEGLTNAEIGDRLFVSRRTVSTHVSHILAKLGLRSRVEVAAEALKRTA